MVDMFYVSLMWGRNGFDVDVKYKEQAGAQGTSLKTGTFLIGNDYQLAA
jgi:hypothetical protein